MCLNNDSFKHVVIFISVFMKLEITLSNLYIQFDTNTLKCIKYKLSSVHFNSFLQQLLSYRTWKVSSMAIYNAVYFRDTMEFSEHYHNCELSYPYHS